MDRLYRGGDCLGVRFGPAKVARQALKKILHFLTCSGLVVALTAPFIQPIFFRSIDNRPIFVTPIFVMPIDGPISRLSNGRIRILWAHGNLTAAIVGEFAR
jgi:hypothetical protein